MAERKIKEKNMSPKTRTNEMGSYWLLLDTHKKLKKKLIPRFFNSKFTIKLD